MSNEKCEILRAWSETLSAYVQYMKHRPGNAKLIEMAMSRRGELAAESNDESSRVEMAWVEVALKSDLTYYDAAQRPYIKRMLALYKDGRLHGSTNMTREQRSVIDPFVKEIESKMWINFAKQSAAQSLLSLSHGTAH
jgi:hypothetical protein